MDNQPEPERLKTSVGGHLDHMTDQSKSRLPGDRLLRAYMLWDTVKTQAKCKYISHSSLWQLNSFTLSKKLQKYWPTSFPHQNTWRQTARILRHACLVPCMLERGVGEGLSAFVYNEKGLTISLTLNPSIQVLSDGCWVVFFSPSGVKFSLHHLKLAADTDKLKVLV